MRVAAMIAVMATLSVVAHAADSRSDAARQAVNRASAQIEAELGGAGVGGIGAVPTGFDPIARAQARLSDWSRVPDPATVAPARAVGVSAVSLPTTRGGMTTQHFARLGATLTFPARAETAEAIRRMAEGRVSSIANYCARTIREALGWGLGDAHEWTALPGRGYHKRPNGSPAQPGDIVVWPFSFGSRNSQHIGIAVGTSSGTKLLSNLSGDLGLSALLPGYLAYWR